ALDGDANTYFASEKDPVKDDHFTLTFDRQVIVKSVEVVTGRPGDGDVLAGGDELCTGELQVSADGKKFTPLGEFVKGTARGTPKGEVKAIRVWPDQHPRPLVIREIKIDSDPPVAVFKYPVEISLDVSDAPEMKEWGEKVVRICEGAYPMINDELKSD